MAIEISTQIIHAIFATVINKIQPGANIYDNPNQQGTTYPAWFIVHRSPVELQRHVGKRNNGNRYLITFQIDLWYMLQQNITRLFDQYTAIAEQLAYNLQYLPIFGSDAVVQVYDQSWSLELNALKYSTTIKLRVYTDENFVFTPMEVISDLEIFLKNQNESIVTFTNTEHPEFDPEFPKSISVQTNRRINLPFVGGKFEDDNYFWIPKAWTLGKFGELIQVNGNETADLVWEFSYKSATLSFTNSTHPEFSVELPSSITEYRGTTITLPTVEAVFPVGPTDWRTVGWDIGDFGDDFVLSEDTVADLQWTNQEILYDVSFTNTTKPQFNVQLPETREVARNNTIVLPTVYGVWYEDVYEWRPSAWDIGAFGDEITVSSNINANLVWESKEVTVYPQGELISGDMQIDPSIITRLSAVDIGGIGIGVMDSSGPQVNYVQMFQDPGISSMLQSNNDIMISSGPQVNYVQYFQDSGISGMMQNNNEIMVSSEQ